MRGPLAIRVNDGQDDRLVTRYATGVKYSKSANGGHMAASMRLNLPRGYFSDLGPADRLWIDNTSTGEQVWCGYTQNPTPSDGPGGQSFDLSALGGMILTSDETRPMLYVSQATSDFAKHVAALESSTAEQVSGDSTTLPFLRVQFAPGSLVTTADTAWTHDVSMGSSDMALGGFVVSTASGKDDDGYRVEFTTSLPQAVPIGFSGAAMSVTGVQQILYVGTEFTAARGFGLRLIRTGGATNVADESTWSLFAGIAYIGQRMNRYGQLLTGAAGLGPANTVVASQVVEDLLGRLLRNAVDPDRAVVAATTMPINQLAFPDGATAQRVLDELGDFESNVRWGVGADDGIPRSRGGRGHEFWYVPISPEPRYEILPADTYRQTGSEVDLCNRVAVHWTDSSGKQQTTIITATSDQYPDLRALEDAGRVRDADPVTLPDGKGSANNALTIGHQLLAAKAMPPRSATAVVSRTVRDLWTGADVHPCELEPGYKVRVRTTGEDIYCTETEYDDDAGATTLTLGDPVPTDAQRFARLSVA